MLRNFSLGTGALSVNVPQDCRGAMPPSASLPRCRQQQPENGHQHRSPGHLLGRCCEASASARSAPRHGLCVCSTCLGSILSPCCSVHGYYVVTQPANGIMWLIFSSFNWFPVHPSHSGGQQQKVQCFPHTNPHAEPVAMRLAGAQPESWLSSL